MSHRFVFTLCAATVVAFLAFSTTPADAHRYRACVRADYDTWLSVGRCRHCREWVHEGRAFRVVRQGEWSLLVWNLSMRGWVPLDAMKLARESYCRAAGI